MFCYVLHSRTRSRPVDDYYFGQVCLLLFQVASAICRLNSFTIDTKSRWAHCCGSRLERIISGSVNVNCLPLKPQHMCCLQELSVSTAAARLLPSSRSRDFVCQCGPSRKKREVWPFQALDVVRTHQRGETTNSPQKTKKTNITIYGQATHIFTPAPTPAWNSDSSATVSPGYLYFLLCSFTCRHFVWNRVALPPHHHLAFWQITINLSQQPIV
jgi:hypothetical protein